MPALLKPGKVTLVIAPVIAIVSDQINTLTSKGIDAVAVGKTPISTKNKTFCSKGIASRVM